MSPNRALQLALATMEERDAKYNRGYERIGKVMSSFFPNGITLDSADDFARYQTFAFMVSKMNRYAQQLTKGGHKDSALDLINYSAILTSLTKEVK